MRVDSLLKLLNECKNPSNCEYLVFRSDGRSISTDFSVEERTKIYEIITILPFPGNTNPLYAERIAELTSNIPYSLDTQEKLVIETVLKQVIGQDLYTLPIPKSMAQFYFFMSQQGALVGAQQQDLIKAITSFEQATLDGLRASRLHEEEIEAIQQGRDSVFQYLRLSISTARKQRFAAVNLAPGFDCMWYGANSSLVKEVVHAADDALPAIYQQLATSWLSNFKKIYQDGGRFYSRFLSGSLSPYIKKLFEFEITVAFSPQFANTCVLYRGSKDGLAGDLTYLATRDNHSFSYGNGFCEGMILDEGACALRYMIATYVNNSKGQCSGHVVFVNTTNYRNHKLERTLFWIPPLNYIARVCAQGETFHARTAGVEGFEMGASLFEKSGEYYSKRTFRVTDELMSSPAMLELINSRRVYATLAP